MKPRVFTTFLFSILFYTAFSQNYKPLLIPGKAWTEIATESVEGFCMSIFLNEPDTIIGIGVGYKITEFFSGDEAWLIEDTNAKKVWYYKENSSMTNPELLYDFSLNVGDTTHIIAGVSSFSGAYTTRFVVTEINPGLWGQRIHVRDIDNQTNNTENIWIESVGAIEGGLLHSMSLPLSPRISKIHQGLTIVYDANFNTNVNDNCFVSNDDYIPMLQGNPTWEEQTLDFGGIIYCNDFSLNGPQMLDSLTGYQTADNHNGVWLFEDESLQQVYYFKAGMTTPQLLFDFSLEVGDFTQVISLGGTEMLEVVETDYYYSSLGSHKVLYLKTSGWISSYSDIWIEGIGAVGEGGFFATLAYTDPIISINKVWKYDKLIYNTGGACMPIIDCTTPPNPTEGEITETTAYVTWDGGAETSYVSYQVQWRIVGTEDWQIGSAGPYSYYTIQNLQPNTPYEWHVKKLCGAQGSTDFTTPRQFMTQTVSIIPIEQANISLWHQNNTIRIKRPNDQSADFFVYDVHGKLLYTQQISKNTAINIHLPNGVYVGLIQEDSGKQYSGKFVVAN